MSIINKMHQGLQEHHDESPILASLPKKQQKKRVLVAVLVTLLLATSIGLSYLIYHQQDDVDSADADVVSESQTPLTMPVRSESTAEAAVTPPPVVAEMVVVASPAKVPSADIKPLADKEPSVDKASLVAKEASPSKEPSVDKASLVAKEASPSKEPLDVKAPLPEEAVPVESLATDPVIVQMTSPVVKTKALPLPKVEPRVTREVKVAKAIAPVAQKAAVAKPPVEKPALPPKATSKAVVKKATSGSHLEIKESQLTDSQLANIHLKNARKAQQEGDTPRVAEENMKALLLQPQLHEVRQSLALYYNSLGDQPRATSLLKKGALQFPEYSDFNLMLARIALKNDKPQHAYLYLQQNPPIVQGHLDYHVSYAILAQKFKDYPRAEILYQGLLTQRPNNGRWRMSLAIAQDKQNKEKLAITNYRKALLQVDLSSNAKKYINQRLTYLASN